MSIPFTLDATQLPGGMFLKNLKYFETILNIFEFSHVWEIAESWFVFASELSWMVQSYFLAKITKLVLSSFAWFLDFLRTKVKFGLQKVTILTVIIW